VPTASTLVSKREKIELEERGGRGLAAFYSTWA
jgi:hypothetical protein